MELKIVPNITNQHPLRGLLIRGGQIILLVKSIQELGLNIADIQVYPIPGISPNTQWGFFIIFRSNPEKIHPGRHELCQQVASNLYIPERSAVYPSLSNAETDKLFRSGKCLIHPEFGLVELSEEINFFELINIQLLLSVDINRPLPSVPIPSRVRSFQIQAASQEQVLEDLAKKRFPQHKKMEDKPLNILEKLKLNLYRNLFKKNSKTTSTEIENNHLGAKLLSYFFSQEKTMAMHKDMVELERRNKKQVDQLLDMLKKDPDEALKYAIPLDEGKTTRGGINNTGSFDILRRWHNFSLFGNSTSNSHSSGTIELGNNFFQLQNQYRETAEALIKKKDFEKAAFVYLKLLKEPDNAAQAMEKGNHFQEAAAIYLRHRGDKFKAAQCYEKGNMITEAIALYKDINQDEKVGDLYISIDKRSEAFKHYEKVVDQFKSKNQYIKASLILRDKMHNPDAAQELLLDGWTKSIDATNCLTNYFSNIVDDDTLHNTIVQINHHHVTTSNRESFLNVLKIEYRQRKKLQEPLREIAFEIIAQQLAINPAVVSELKHFNPENKELSKDTMRYRLNKSNDN